MSWSTGTRNSRAGSPGKATRSVLPYAVDPEAAARLWEISERLNA